MIHRAQAKSFVKGGPSALPAAQSPARTFGRSRNDPLTPKVRKHPKKHLLGVHEVVESETAGLAGIGDDVVIRREDAVRVAPGRDLFETEFLQSVPFDDFFPDRPLVRHGPRKVDMSWRSQLHPEEVSELGPQMLPPDKYAVCHLKPSASSCSI